MNDLMVFSNLCFGEIRAKIIGNEPMFCLADICRVLGIKNISDCKSRLNQKGVAISDTLTKGGRQSMTYINEPNLYKTIFQSRKEEAEKFTDWVTEEVIPSIRKNGGYISNQEDLTPEQIVANALIVAQNIIAERDRQIEELKPKAEFYDAVADSKDAIPMDAVAKVLGIKGFGRNKIFGYLKESSILDKNNLPYQEYVNLGWFKTIEETYVSKGETKIYLKTLVYPKGVDAIRRKLKMAGLFCE